MNLFATKPIATLRAEAEATGEHALKRVLGPLNLVTLGIGADHRFGDAELDGQRHQLLLRAVVEVALEPPPRLVAGPHDAGPRGGEVRARLGVGERLRGKLGEVADALLGAFGERLELDARGNGSGPRRHPGR